MSQETEGKKRGMFSRLFGGGQSAPAPEVAPEMAPQPAPEEEKRSWWSRLSGGLSRTSQAITQGVADVFTKRKLDALTLEELEDVLLRADLGVGAATRITEAVGKARYERDIEPEEVREILAREVERVLAPVAQPLVVDDSKSPFTTSSSASTARARPRPSASSLEQFRRGQDGRARGGRHLPRRGGRAAPGLGRARRAPVYGGAEGADSGGARLRRDQRARRRRRRPFARRHRRAAAEPRRT